MILNLTLRMVLKIFLMYSKNVLDVDCQTQGRLKLMIVLYYRCLKICKFRIQSVVGKDPVELEKHLGKKNRSS
jgi:hypothetical protein